MKKSECEMRQECQEMSDLLALEQLTGEERQRFEKHLGECQGCSNVVAANRLALSVLPPSVPPHKRTRDWVLDLAKAPHSPVAVESYSWEEIAPGVRVHVFCDDRQRSVRSQLMWADPGAVRPAHRHVGEEEILVLEGGLVVGGGRYQPGEICVVSAGALHSEHGAVGERCVCFVVHRSAEGVHQLSGEPDSRCASCVFFPLHSMAFPGLVTA